MQRPYFQEDHFQRWPHRELGFPCSFLGDTCQPTAFDHRNQATPQLAAHLILPRENHHPSSHHKQIPEAQRLPLTTIAIAEFTFTRLCWLSAQDSIPARSQLCRILSGSPPRSDARWQIHPNTPTCDNFLPHSSALGLRQVVPAWAHLRSCGVLHLSGNRRAQGWEASSWWHGHKERSVRSCRPQHEEPG